MNSQFLSGLATMFHEVVVMALDKFYSTRNSRNEDIVISMPQFLIALMPQALYMHSFMCPFSGTSVNPTFSKYMGIDVQPSADLAITVFLKDYPLYHNPDMIVKVPLTRISVEHKHYQTVLITLSKYFNISLLATLN